MSAELMGFVMFGSTIVLLILGFPVEEGVLVVAEPQAVAGEHVDS